MQQTRRLFFPVAFAVIVLSALSLPGCSSERGLDRVYDGESAPEFFSKVLNEASKEEAQAVTLYTPGVMMGVLASAINPSAGSFNGMTARAIFQQSIGRDLESKKKSLAELQSKADVQSVVSKISILSLTTNAASIPAEQRGGMRNAIQLSASVKNGTDGTIAGVSYEADVFLNDEEAPVFSVTDGVSFPLGLPSGQQVEVVGASNWMDSKWETVAVRTAKKFDLRAKVTSYTDDRGRRISFDQDIQGSIDKAQKEVDRLESLLKVVSKQG